MTGAGYFNVKLERANQYSSTRVSAGYRMILYGARDQTSIKCGFLKGDVPQITPRCDSETQSIVIKVDK